MDISSLYKKALNFEFLSVEEGVYLFEHAPLSELMNIADLLRQKQVPHGKVTWQIDRNV
ncbi:MAG: dehypoxanthine futalosine cyclase, partial [Bacteroidota bacterium]